MKPGDLVTIAGAQGLKPDEPIGVLLEVVDSNLFNEFNPQEGDRIAKILWRGSSQPKLCILRHLEKLNQ
jgi:hypothetical protein|tara:strand:+ start:12121 stop:12327 length:207 start_codon:yes stop_codon:yes gene_type:complete